MLKLQMTRVCFGRLVSIRRILVLCISNFQSRKLNNCWLWKYEFGEKSKSRQNLKPLFSTRCIFHKFGAQDWVFKSWVLLEFLHLLTLCFVKDYSVLVGRHTIFQYFLVKRYLCSLHPFKLHCFEKDAEYQNNH